MFHRLPGRHFQKLKRLGNDTDSLQQRSIDLRELSRIQNNALGLPLFTSSLAECMLEDCLRPAILS
jgi:hypothetical protein